MLTLGHRSWLSSQVDQGDDIEQKVLDNIVCKHGVRMSEAKACDSVANTVWNRQLELQQVVGFNLKFKKGTKTTKHVTAVAIKPQSLPTQSGSQERYARIGYISSGILKARTIRSSQTDVAFTFVSDCRKWWSKKQLSSIRWREWDHYLCSESFRF